MPVLEVIEKRYSVRAYEDRPVESDKLERILEAARLAPSAGNRQEWRFIIVTDPEKRQGLMRAARNQAFVGQAPVVIAACAEGGEHVMMCGQPSYTIDVAIALEHIALQATAEGLGTCWVGAFDENEAKNVLNVPGTARIVQIMPLGYPADQPHPKTRKELKEIVMYEAWGQHAPPG